MNYTIIAHLAYLPTAVTAAVWVGHTLHRHGRIFLVDAFHANEALADAVNHLLLVGWYLVNIGFIALALRYGARPESWTELVEGLATKLGLVLLVLGAMHFLNLYVFSKMRRRAKFDAMPPVPPAGALAR